MINKVTTSGLPMCRAGAFMSQKFSPHLVHNRFVSCLGANGLIETKLQNAPSAADRRWPRFPVDMPVEVRVTTDGPTRVITCDGRGTDISAGGLAISVDLELPLGSQVGVEFRLPRLSDPIRFRCFVRNREDNHYGVEFITENDQDYENTGRLQQILAAAAAC